MPILFGWLAILGLLGVALALCTYNADDPHRPTMRAMVLHGLLTVWVLAGLVTPIAWRLT